MKEFTLKNIDERKNYFLEEIELKEFMSRNHKKIGTTLSHIEYIFIFASAITGCISISAFASLFSIPIGITSSAVGLNVWAITAGVKKYKWIIKKKKKKHDKIIFSANLT